ncbi:unnamed protein product [Withania somnifera]
MGRKISLGEVHSNHPLIYFLFLTAAISSIISIVSSLCGLLERIKGSPKSSRGDIKQNTIIVNTSRKSRKKSENNILQQQFPPPPTMREINSHNLRTNSMAPTRVFVSNSSMKSLQKKLSTSTSMKTFSRALTQCHEKSNSKPKNEDSIWKKQIILGEKCKVSNQDEDDDTILYDENGNRILIYHSKQLNVMSVSRQSSEINTNSIPK